MNIQEELNKAESFNQAESIAEDLTYKISYKHKVDTWRTRYSYLNHEDFTTLGWKVYCLGRKDSGFQKKLMAQGYKPLVKYSYRGIDENNLYNKEEKELFMFNDYPSGNLMSIEHDKVEDLISLDEYKALLGIKLQELLEARNKVREFLESMIELDKKWYEENIEEEKREKIINEALQKAKSEGLIKS